MPKLNKRKIIKKRWMFNEVYRKGRSFADRNMALYVLSADDGRTQVGFAAGKKLGCAPLRNRIKRLMRESFRHLQGNVADGVRLLLIGRKAAAAAKEREVEKSLEGLLKRAKIFKYTSG